jgi:hypothetical protein
VSTIFFLVYFFLSTVVMSMLGEKALTVCVCVCLCVYTQVLHASGDGRCVNPEPAAQILKSPSYSEFFTVNILER